MNTSARGLAVLCVVEAFSVVEGRGPTLSEIGRILRITKSGADARVKRLIRQGALERSGAVVKRTHHAPGIEITKKHREASPQP